MEPHLELPRADLMRALQYHVRRCVVLARLVEGVYGGPWTGSVSLDAARLCFSFAYYEADLERMRADAAAVVVVEQEVAR